MSADVAPYRVGKTARSAVALKLAGASYSEIAETLGFAGPVEARNAVERDLANQAIKDSDGIEALRTEESMRIQRLLRSVWRKATDEADPEHLPAVRVALSLIDRNIRLRGLDAPTEVVVHNPAQAEIDAWVAMVTQHEAIGLGMEDDVIVIGHDPDQ